MKITTLIASIGMAILTVTPVYAYAYHGGGNFHPGYGYHTYRYVGPGPAFGLGLFGLGVITGTIINQNCTRWTGYYDQFGNPIYQDVC